MKRTKVLAVAIACMFCLMACSKKNNAESDTSSSKTDKPPVIANDKKGTSTMKTETLIYKYGDLELIGYLAYDPSIKGKRPGVLVVHDWMGPGEHAFESCRKLAQMGYIALAADIYGKEDKPTNRQQAGKVAGKFRSGDRALLRAHALAGLEALKAHELTDTSNVAAIGYCFGGTTVLEIARSGADIKAIVSFHGGLNTEHPEDAKNIKCKLLILHGLDDPHVPATEVEAFNKEMNAAKVDMKFIGYPGAVHAFTNPKAGNDPSKGAAYNAQAAEKSWAEMKSYFSEVFN